MSYVDQATPGMAVYIINHKGRMAILDSFDSAFRHLARAELGKEVYDKCGSLDQFEGLNTQELAGTFFHSLKFAMWGAGVRDSVIEEHRVTPLFQTPTAARRFNVINELDPAFTIQVYLYQMSLGKNDPEVLSNGVFESIKSQIHFERLSLTDREIVEKIIDASHRYGGNDLGAQEADTLRSYTEFLNALPEIAKSRFDELAAKAFPAPQLAI
jgi:hypothetical protein